MKIDTWSWSISGIIIVTSLLFFYFLPAIFAFNRGKTNRAAILALNLFLGWTFLGWLAALIWALLKDAQLPATQVGTHPPPYPPPQAPQPPPQTHAIPTYDPYPHRPAGLSAWLLTPLVALAFLGVLYLAVAYFRDAPPRHEPPGISKRPSHSKLKSKMPMRQDRKEAADTPFSSRASGQFERNNYKKRGVERETPPASALPETPAGTVPPVLMHRVDAEYSEEALSARREGTVTLAAEVDTDGRVVNAHVTRGLGLGLDEKALEAVQRWRYRPALKDGRTIPFPMQIEFTFRLGN